MVGWGTECPPLRRVPVSYLTIVMKSLSYRGKLLLNFAIIFVIFAVVLVIFQQNREREHRRELIETRLRSYADLVAGSIEDQGIDNDSLQFFHLVHLLPDDLRLTVITRAGRVRYESDTAVSRTMGDHAGRPEVRAALSNNEGHDIRLSETTGQTYFYYAQNYGAFIVRVALPYNSSVQEFMKADNVFLWFVLLVFPVILVVLISISDHFGKSIAGLRRFIEQAEHGLVDYDHITFPRTELGDIGRAIMLKYKQLELTGRQIATERERLMRHFHYFEEGIAIFSADRKKVYANPRFTQYVNTILDHPTPDVNTIWREKAFAPAVEFLSIDGEREAPMMDAPIFRFSLHAGGCYFAVQLLIYGDGGFEMTLADVTRAEKARVLKQQMSNNITHELRTPVSSIRGYIETILENPTLTPERQRYFLGKAHSQVVRLTDLIRDVALITKTEEAPEMMPREQLAIAHMVDDIVEELRTGLSEAHMTVENAISPDVSINGNYSLVYSIFRNLMENSLRYAGEGTKIRVECYNEDTVYCYFRYYDTGGGVPEKHLPRLFERFYRLTEGRTRDCGGTGLGLSIVRNAVLFHAGTISVRNRKGGGLEYIFTLKK